jgi:hypothetical protein
MSEIVQCYGRYNGSKKCDECNLAEYCQQAKEVDERSFPVLDFSSEEIAESSCDNYLAQALREVFAAINEVCSSNSRRMAILISRIGGMTYQEIGSRWGISKAGVGKQISEIAKKNRRIAEVLSMRYPPVIEALLPFSVETAKEESEFVKEFKSVKVSLSETAENAEKLLRELEELRVRQNNRLDAKADALKIIIRRG